MRSCASAAILLALEAYCVSGTAFGQAPSQSLGADESVVPQESITVIPGGAQVAGDVSGRGNPLSVISLESLRATRERPLFSATRRPPPPPVPEEVVVEREPAAVPQVLEPEKPKLDLIGVVHGPLVSMAVFLDQTNHSLVRLRIGQSFRGWAVHGLDTREATLEKAEQQVKLELPARSAATTATSLSPAEAAALMDQ